MPIRKELRKLYKGPQWERIRNAILTRADDKCEQCAKPNGMKILVIRDGSGRWWNQKANEWRNKAGEVLPDWKPGPTLPLSRVFWIQAQLGIAHLDHNPQNQADDNLKALCNRCHLEHDRKHHAATARRTRARKRGQLWISEEIERAIEPTAGITP